jgi:transposase
MDVCYTRCAGLDVHKKSVVACRIETQAEGRKVAETRTFGTTTRQLLDLLTWLLEWNCTHVAMESTGEYWKPIYAILEGHVELLLVNACHLKHVPGRKTDVKDAEWLADVLRYGLLRGSFVPPQAQRDLRDLTRQRIKLVRERASVVNRLQKVLEGANIKLASVVTDVLGVSARAMLEALLAGTNSPAEMADLAQSRLRQKLDQLEEALEGRMRDHHRFLLRHHLEHIDFLDQALADYDAEIDRRLTDQSTTQYPASAPDVLPDRPTEVTATSPATAPSAHATAPHEAPDPVVPVTTASDGTVLPPLTPCAAIELLDTIPGVNRRLAEVIIAEVGTDMRPFASAKHLAAWAGVAPGNNESAGKKRSGRPRPGNPTLRMSLIQAAHGAARTKEGYLRAQYDRLARRRGRKRALGAVAHSIIVAVYAMLSRHEAYHDLGSNYFDERQREQVANRLVHRLEHLGYTVEVAFTPAPAPAASG